MMCIMCGRVGADGVAAWQGLGHDCESFSLEKHSRAN